MSSMSVIQCEIAKSESNESETNKSEVQKTYKCRHIFTDGRRCGSPSLRRENFCYYHQSTRPPVDAGEVEVRRVVRSSDFVLPVLEDRSAVQMALGEVLQRIAANELDPRRAGLLLYGLQTAVQMLSREKRDEEQSPYVEEVVQDPVDGPIACVAERVETPEFVKGPAESLLERLDRECPE